MMQIYIITAKDEDVNSESENLDMVWKKSELLEALTTEHTLQIVVKDILKESRLSSTIFTEVEISSWR